jgi:hypothetical protein
MTIANGLAQTPTNLKPSEHGEALQLTQMHLTILAHQLMAILSPSAHQAVAQLKGLYTWTNHDEKEEEMDGLTILTIGMVQARVGQKLIKSNKIMSVLGDQ